MSLPDFAASKTNTVGPSKPSGKQIAAETNFAQFTQIEEDTRGVWLQYFSEGTQQETIV